MSAACAFSKVVRPGTVKVGRRWVSLFVEISWDGSRLSLCGVEGPNTHGGAVGSSGQCGIDASIRPAKGWTLDMIAALRSAWDRWHLNDMKAGTPAQEAEIDRRMALACETDPDCLYEPGEINMHALSAKRLGKMDAYGLSCAWLKEAGLYEVPDPRFPAGSLNAWGQPCVPMYAYGSAWLRREVPDDVVAMLAALPETDIPYPWTPIHAHCSPEGGAS